MREGERTEDERIGFGWVFRERKREHREGGERQWKGERKNFKKLNTRATVPV